MSKLIFVIAIANVAPGFLPLAKRLIDLVR